MQIQGRTALTMSQAVGEFLLDLSAYRGCADSTVTTYAGDLRGFLSYLAPTGLSRPPQVTRHVMQDYVRSLCGREPKLSPKTIRRKVACASAFFNYLMDEGHIESNPAHRLTLPKAEKVLPVSLSREETRRLVAAADTPWTRCLIVLLLTCGLRRAEVSSIELGDINWEHAQLLVRGKGNKQRLVPLTEKTLTALRSYVPPEQRNNGHSSKRLFLSRWGQPIHPRVVNQMFNRVRQAAGMPHLTPHKLRHTCATQLLREGKDIAMVRDFLGHTNIETTGGYLHSDLGRMRQAVAGLDDLIP